ncbi:hypothetical protein SISNIDRAFT_525795 [Sistotremastrum niveocremeum HHB9708]|uniref:Uncharacterized protein n=1 Tax=Sistotremastrum niveocremeum HHB9708 TaxID=1314777 RepID=A0A164QVZ0_9AGAM|nr:hypothetical protein SISNIDRAFT_525795 [Sistotremastrum niveocremeum HHB9708]
MVLSPTLIQPPPPFPLLLPDPPQPYPVPLPKYGQRRQYFNARRDLCKELADLSDSENEFEEMTEDIKHRGFSFLIPLGKTLTQHEEKNDAQADESSDDEQSTHSPVGSQVEEGENDSAVDLDANMEDLDETGENDDQDLEPDDQTGDYEDDGDETRDESSAAIETLGT